MSEYRGINNTVGLSPQMPALKCQFLMGAHVLKGFVRRNGVEGKNCKEH